jgi:hypothetical protein
VVFNSRGLFLWQSALFWGIEIRSREFEKLISDYPGNFWGAFGREVRAELVGFKHLRGDVELISELAVVAGHEDQAFK